MHSVTVAVYKHRGSHCLTPQPAVAAALAVEMQLVAKESERLAAVMRAEKAEAGAVASHNELLEVTKR